MKDDQTLQVVHLRMKRSICNKHSMTCEWVIFLKDCLDHSSGAVWQVLHCHQDKSQLPHCQGRYRKGYDASREASMAVQYSPYHKEGSLYNLHSMTCEWIILLEPSNRGQSSVLSNLIFITVRVRFVFSNDMNDRAKSQGFGHSQCQFFS